MSTSGFHLEGLVRSLQGEIMTLVGFMVLLLIVWVIFRKAISASDASPEEASGALKTGRITRNTLAILAIALFAWRVVTVASANRLPRSDVDKSEVYQQMDEKTKKPTDAQAKEKE